jgi:hypothetical protein
MVVGIGMLINTFANALKIETVLTVVFTDLVAESIVL